VVLVVKIIIVVDTFTLGGNRHETVFLSVWSVAQDIRKFLLYHSARILFFCFLRSVFKHFLIKKNNHVVLGYWVVWASAIMVGVCVKWREKEPRCQKVRGSPPVPLSRQVGSGVDSRLKRTQNTYWRRNPPISPEKSSRPIMRPAPVWFTWGPGGYSYTTYMIRKRWHGPPDVRRSDWWPRISSARPAHNRPRGCLSVCMCWSPEMAVIGDYKTRREKAGGVWTPTTPKRYLD